MRILTSLIALVLLTSWAISADNTTASLVTNYQQWGWDAVVMQNGLVTIAILPDVGGRILQYDLGTHPSMWINSAELGKTYTPSGTSGGHTFGGFMNWPSPQARWGWPPPPTIDYGKYATEIKSAGDDSCVVSAVGQKEKWSAAGLHFERQMTMYKGSSRVKVEQTLVNEGTTAASWGVWDITESLTHHAGETDYENFWVYFPVTTDSIWFDTPDKRVVRGEVAPGIYGAQYFPVGGMKIFANNYAGWIAYVDKRDGYAYIKKYDIVQGANYPLNDNSIKVDKNGFHDKLWLGSTYWEIEIVAPVVELQPNGGKYTFVEDWYATRVYGPILAVNESGAVENKLVWDAYTKVLSGKFGVFYVGQAQIAFIDKNGGVIEKGNSYNVTPMEKFELAETITSVPENTDTIQLILQDANGKQIGVLDQFAMSEAVKVNYHDQKQVSAFALNQNYPNPFNPTTTIQFSLSNPGYVNLTIFNMSGKEITTLISRKMGAGDYRAKWDASGLASGVYLARFQVGDYCEYKKLILMK
jgi:hypothetical protein